MVLSGILRFHLGIHPPNGHRSGSGFDVASGAKQLEVGCFVLPCCKQLQSRVRAVKVGDESNDWIKWSSHWNSWHMNVHPKVNIQNNHRTYRSWTKSMSCPQNSSPGFLWSLRNPIIVPVVVPYVKPPSSSCLVPYVWRILPAVFHGFEPIFHG